MHMLTHNSSISGIASVLVVAIAVLAGDVSLARAGQAGAAAEPTVVYGHHHFNASDPDAHRRFWGDGLGGTPAVLDGMAVPIFRFPGTLVFLRAQAPTKPMSGTVVNRLRFSVRSLSDMTTRLKNAGFDVEASTPGVAVTRGPDDVVVELVESSTERDVIAYRELIIGGTEPEAMRAWYVRHLPGLTADPATSTRATISGAALVFERTAAAEGTRGSSLDHVGFEIDGLEAYCAELARRGIVFERPYTRVPNTDLFIAFFTDPWGTNIELTEGLDTVR